MPRSSSTVSSPQVLAPPTYFQASLGHVSYPKLPRARNRVELPGQLAGDHVERANIARRRHPPFAGRIAENEKVLPDLAGVRHANAVLAAQHALAQIDVAIRPEGHDRLAGPGIDGLEVRSGGEEQPLFLTVLALPVVDAPRRQLQVLVNPDFLARRRIERDERIAATRHEHHVVDDDGVEPEVAVRIEPGDLQLLHVGFVDLIEIGEVRARWSAAMIPPPLLASGRRQDT